MIIINLKKDLLFLQKNIISKESTVAKAIVDTVPTVMTQEQTELKGKS